MKFFVITKTLLKSLFSKPATVKYPFGPREYFKGTRGKITVQIDQCIFCGICQRKCPTHALSVDKAVKKWTIRRGQCIVCGACVEVCPKKCLTMDNQYSDPVLLIKEESHHA